MRQVPPHRRPLTLPRAEDDARSRADDSVKTTLLGLQSKKRLIPVRASFDSASSIGIVYRGIFDAFTSVRIVEVYFEALGLPAPSGTDYWTFNLNELNRGGSLRTIGSFNTKTSPAQLGGTPLKRFSFGQLAQPIVKKGNRITLDIVETGAAGTYGPGSLVLLLEEID
jgi:hypothetical protein